MSLPPPSPRDRQLAWYVRVAPAARNRDLLVVDVWDLSFDKLHVPRDPECVCCAPEGEVERL